MTQAIFLSYSSDDADTARRLCDALRAAGLEVWFDQSELRGGDAWDASIKKQIKECTLFVPMISASTNARSEGYFRLEWKLAVDRSHLMADNKAFFVPVMLGDVSEPAALVPDKFRERQWSRLNDDQAITAFATRVGKLIAGSGSSGINATNTSPVLEGRPSIATPAHKTDEGFWVAVLPFKYRGSNADLVALAEGMSEEIVTGLSRFSYLRVVARGATLQFTSEAVDVRAIGKELGARYVMEGSLRQAGSTLRVAVQLVDASNGAHLWAETYDRAFKPEDIFALQDDLVPRIVSTVADAYGVLPHSMSNSLRGRAPDQLTPYEAVIRSFGYYERITPEEHAEVRACLEYAVEKAPGNADCWAVLSLIYVHEYNSGFNVRPDALGRTVSAAQRAVAAGPANHSAYHALAWALHFRKEYQASLHAAERAMALNPMDASTIARMGLMIAYAGDWARGCSLIERARQLNPNHPGWYWRGDFFNAYRQHDYRGALNFALKDNKLGYFYSNAMLAATYAQLGERDAATNALRALLAQMPNVALVARTEFGKWIASEEIVELIVDGLRKAGLDIPADKGTATPTPATEEVSIAVLAFANRSASADDEYFSDGLADELLNVLAKIKGLRVAARTSAFSFKGKQTTVAEIGRVLNVATVLEGSVRKSGNRVRISVQLVKVGDGFQLWGETYDRTLDDIFAVQDDIAQAVVTELRAALLGDGAATLSESIAQEIQNSTRARSANPEAQRLVLQARFYKEKRRPADIEYSIALCEEAIALDPEYADAHACLADAWQLMSAYGSWQSAADGARLAGYASRARASAKSALLHDATLAAPHITLSWIACIGDHDRATAVREAQLAQELTPNGADALRTLGHRLMEDGKFSEAEALLFRAVQLDPLWMPVRLNYSMVAQWSGRHEEALHRVREAFAVDDSSWIAHWQLGSVLNSLGEHAGAAEALAQACTLRGAHDAAGFFRQAFAAGGWQGYLAAVAGAPQHALARIQVMWAQVQLGRLDDAIATTNAMVGSHDQHVVWLKHGPFVEPLRGDPRFQALLKRAGFSE